MKALVDTVAKTVVLVQKGYFPVSPPLKWVDCDEGVAHYNTVWDGEKLVPKPGFAETWLVLKATIRGRLRGQDALLNGLPHWWADAPAIRSDDAAMRAVLEGAGADPDLVLARDPAARALFGKLIT